jgi:hypothetical protein
VATDSSLPLSPSPSPGPGLPNASPSTTTQSLAAKALQIEKELADFAVLLEDARKIASLSIARLQLCSRAEAAGILLASLSQLDRWKSSGELPYADLDSKPRYRLADLEAFIQSRIQSGRKPSTRRSKKGSATPSTLKAKTEKTRLL